MNIRKVRDELYKGQAFYTMPLRVTFYARVSTEKYEQASSLENQVDYFTDYIQKNANWTFVNGYIDEGISGTSTLKRDSFIRMIADAKAGLFDFIITKEISRFSRSTLDSIHYTQELLNMGVGVFFQNDNINTLDTDSEFRLVVMAGVAQDEVRKLSERLKFGFRQSIKNGRVLGNNSLYGYNKENCKLTVNEEEAEVVRLIFDLYAGRRMGLRKLSQYLYDTKGITSSQGNAFNTTTIKNMILNPKYKGYYCANKSKSIDYKSKKSVKTDESEWIVYKDENVPAIVSEDIWDKANALLKTRGKALRESGAEYHNCYPYSGKLICAEHNTSFHRQVLKSSKGEKEIWQCKTYRTKGLDGCSAPQLRSSELDAVMAAIFTEIYQDKDSFVDQTLALIENTPDEKNYQSDITKLQNEIDSISIKKDKLLDMAVEGALTNQEFKARNDKFNEQIERLKNKIRILTEEQNKSKVINDNLAAIKKAIEQELNFENGINSELVSCVLYRIVVHNTGDRQKIKLEIHLKAGNIIPFEYDRRDLSFCSNFSLSHVQPDGDYARSASHARTCRHHAYAVMPLFQPRVSAAEGMSPSAPKALAQQQNSAITVQFPVKA